MALFNRHSEEREHSNIKIHKKSKVQRMVSSDKKLMQSLTLPPLAGVLLLIMGCSIASAQSKFSHTDTGSTVLFDNDWRFYKGDLPHAEALDFDDTKWRKVDVPHDWSIEDLPSTRSPFSPDAVSGVNTGFTTGGIGWYRKTFRLLPSQKSKRILIHFDGVYMNADVWLNGIAVGKHPYGYTSFYFDITDKIKRNEANIIAVQVKTVGVTSRWYSGSGIYRHVWLQALQPVHIATWSTYIITPEVSTSAAEINIKTKALNESNAASDVTLVTKIINEKGQVVAQQKSKQKIEAGNHYEFNHTCNVSQPRLWSPDAPQLYTCVSEVYSNNNLQQKQSSRFGIRSLSFTSEKGFLLNEKPLKLKGACFHNDNGPLGSKAYDRAEARKVQLLKENGFNAIRCTHNPPSPAFLNACDSLGMLVVGEAFDMWSEAKNEGDYHLFFNDWWRQDIESMLLRDRNHPCIILWSIGNEIPNMDSPAVAATAKIMSDFIHEKEPTRPVTAAVNAITEKKDNFFSALDVCGYNYGKLNYESDHQRLPQRVMFASESFPLEAFDYWMNVVDHPYVIGDFVWTGFDYMGEASIGWRGYEQELNFYPWNLAFCGDIDICGSKRPQSFYRDVLWKDNQLSLFVTSPKPSFPLNEKKQPWSVWNWDDVLADWNWQGYEDSLLEVTAYSSCDEAELFINGKSLGRKPTNRSTKFMAKWSVPYSAGELKAIGYKGSQIVITKVLRTANAASQIKLSADRNLIKADGQDLSYINVQVTDENNNLHPKADNVIHFSIEGPATIAGVGNANPMSLESDQQPVRKAWQGKCLVIIKSENKPGSIILKAKARGLTQATITITSK